MIYFTIAVLLLLVILLIYYRYKKSDNPKQLIQSIMFVGIVLFFTYISKVIIVHKPIFVLHLALVILSWIGLFLYLVKNRLQLWMVLAPLASTILFFAMALFFRENA
jgi:hypothetical protein